MCFKCIVSITKILLEVLLILKKFKLYIFLIIFVVNIVCTSFEDGVINSYSK